MNENDNDARYEQMRVFAQQFFYRCIEGITLEMKMFFCDRLEEGRKRERLNPLV